MIEQLRNQMYIYLSLLTLLKPTSSKYVSKPRYCSVSYYASNRPICKSEYNDLKYPIHQGAIQMAQQLAKEEGFEIDEKFLPHIGYLFSRDPLFVFKDMCKDMPPTSTCHLDNFQGSIWTTVRLKPPPTLDSSISWRVEFRPCDQNLTAEENVATAVLVQMFAQLVTYEKTKLNFYIPISLVDENISRAVKKDAITSQKFWWRKNIIDTAGYSKDEYIELSLEEWLIGNKDFPGFYHLYSEFIDELISSNPDKAEFYRAFREECFRATEIILQRAQGKRMTTAALIRKFVTEHSAYEKNSVVNEVVMADLQEFLIRSSYTDILLSLIHISEPTRQAEISYAVFCLKKKKL
eukprot:TRINITY_DN4293_c0_g1_i9.p1 TRINITY_DN4293_c0_g1~~TRINITY_DN4293_c0_g1_i9.p1  ORF type:complete len:350 (-),score=63.72 TRINITY_DN4293_c0_g1_i9:34-1083(-)